MPNPGNPESKLLLVMGRTPQELSAAAQTLALGSVALSGSTQVVGAPDIPERQAYDAPRWIPMNLPVIISKRSSKGRRSRKLLTQFNTTRKS
jgi:cellulose synthase (UDP-forming)